jgi:hypothetical protein
MLFAGMSLRSLWLRRVRCAVALMVSAPIVFAAAQQPAPQRETSPAAKAEPAPARAAEAPHNALEPSATASVSGKVTDTDGAAVPSAHVSLQDVESNATRNVDSDDQGGFFFAGVPPGRYVVSVRRAGFSPWKIRDVVIVAEGQNVVLPEIQLGVEEINTTVNAITVEKHQRILGALPNFYVSYVPDAAPLTRKQKFKLAVHVSADPVTYFSVGVNAGIEQWQGDFAGYGQGFSGFAQRYAATYGDRLSSTFLGAAALPSLLHQDPRYFYRGHGKIIVRALYAISTTVVCKGDNGHWQPNYSNVLGNLGAAGISTLYYPASDQHSVQVTVDNTLLGVAEGAFGTLFQEFLLKHLTKGVPKTPPQP